MKKTILTIAVATFTMMAVYAQENTKTPVKIKEIKPVPAKIQKTDATHAHSAQAQPAAAVTPQNPNAPEMKFETDVIDYGTVEYNGNGVREFKFKNTGKEPLIISRAKGSCGCTVPTWPKEPIMPGDESVIKVKYATNRPGRFTKTVTITSNAKTPTKRLTIKGTVKPKPVAPADQTVPVKKEIKGATPLKKASE